MESVRAILYGSCSQYLNPRSEIVMLRAECPGKSQKAAEVLLGKKQVGAGRNLKTMKSCSFYIWESPALNIMNMLILMPSKGVST